MELFKKLLVIALFVTGIFSHQGIELDPLNYQNEVLGSEEAWLIEYYSKSCGSCSEFAGIWDVVVPSFNKLKIGRISIDTKAGMEMADRFGVLDEGIPCVKLVYGRKGEQVTVMASDVMKEPEFKKAVEKAISEKLKNMTKTQKYEKSEL